MNIQYIYLSILSFGRSMIKVHIIRMLKNYSCEIAIVSWRSSVSEDVWGSAAPAFLTASTPHTQETHNHTLEVEICVCVHSIEPTTGYAFFFKPTGDQ